MGTGAVEGSLGTGLIPPADWAGIPGGSVYPKGLYRGFYRPQSLSTPIVLRENEPSLTGPSQTHLHIQNGISVVQGRNLKKAMRDTMSNGLVERDFLVLTLLKSRC